MIARCSGWNAKLGRLDEGTLEFRNLGPGPLDFGRPRTDWYWL